MISKAVAESLARAAGKDLPAIIAKAKADRRVAVGRHEAHGDDRARDEDLEIPVPNVVGYLEGSDPTLKNELVIIGSHLDHLGRSSSGEICNGADDDGSGSTGVLAVSRAFTKNPRPPEAERPLPHVLRRGEGPPRV